MRTTKMIRALALSVLLAVLGCGGPEERKAEYTARAQQYIQEGNFPKARVSLRNVLKIDPQDAEAYFLFAQVEEKEKNWRSAFGNYLKVVELKPDHRGALARLGRFYLEGRAHDKVVEMADKILARYPGDMSAEILKAAVLGATGRLDEAVVRAEEIVKLHPTNPDGADLLASIYIARNRLADAKGVLQLAVNANPGHVLLLNDLGIVEAKLGHVDGAERAFLQIIAAEPKVFDHRLKLALFYDYNKKLDKAEAVLREAVRQEPDGEQRRLTLAEYLANRRGVQQGEAALLEARKDLPHAMKIRFALGKLYEGDRQNAKARRVYEEIVEEEALRPPGLEARVRLGALDLAEGKWEAAEKRLQEVLKENPRASDALVLQGKMAMERGDGKEAVRAFRTVLKEQPNAVEIHTLLGRAYLMSGEASLARESWEKTLKINPRQVDARRSLAGLEAGEGRRQEARRLLEEILKNAPKDWGTLEMLLNLQVADRDWEASEQTLTRLRDAGTGSFAADMAEGNVFQARGQWDKALAAFDRAAGAFPDAPEPLFALVRIDLAQGKTDRAQARLNETLSRRPTHPYAHGMLGEVLLLQGDAARAEQEFQEAGRLKPDWVTPWLDRATLKLSQKKPAEAILVLNAGVKANPRSEELRLILATTLGETGQTDQAIKEYEAILRANPRSVLAANNLASILTDHKGDLPSLERALALTRDFEKTAPGPFYLDTLGWVHLKLGHTDEAVRVMRQAVAKASDQPVLNYHLGIAYSRTGEMKEARMHLEKALHSGKPFPGLDEARAALTKLKG